MLTRKRDIYENIEQENKEEGNYDYSLDPRVVWNANLDIKKIRKRSF